MGTRTVPAARITPLSTLAMPNSTLPATAMCSARAARSITAGSVVNRPAARRASAATSNASPPVSARFMPSPMRVTCGSCDRRPAPMAWAANTEAAIEIEMAGNCT